MATFTDRLAILITANAQGAARELQGFGNTTEAEMGKAEGASGRLGQAVSGLIPGLGNLETQGISTGKILGIGLAAGAAAGGVALADFAVKGVAQFESVTAEVRTLQRTFGDSAEDASKLRFAAKTLGIDLDTLARSAGLLAKGIGNGTSKLKDYGVEVAHDKQGNVDMAGTIQNIAAAYQATDDPSRRAAIGAAAFGRGWQAIAPLLTKSKDEIAALYAEAGKEHQIFNQKDLEQGRELSVATRELHTEVQGLQIELARTLAPAFAGAAREAKGFLQVLDDVISKAETSKGSNAPSFFDSFADIFKKAAGNAHVLSGAWTEMESHIPGIGKGLSSNNAALTAWNHNSSAATTSSHNATHAAQDHAKAATEDAKAILAESQALQGQIDASLGYEGSLRQLQQATQDYQKAQLLAIAAKGQDTSLNQDANNALFALKLQIQATAEAAGAKAKEDLGPNADATRATTAANDAYRGSLLAAANSSIPAVRQQALLLLAQLQALGDQHPVPTVDVDTTPAHQKLTALEDHFAQTRKLFAGGIGRVQ